MPFDGILYISPQLVHYPLHSAPQPCTVNVSADIFAAQRQQYCSMVHMLDAFLARVEALLQSQWDDSLTWVVSDNGAMPAWSTQPPASAGSNDPLRARGGGGPYTKEDCTFHRLSRVASFPLEEGEAAKKTSCSIKKNSCWCMPLTLSLRFLVKCTMRK